MRIFYCDTCNTRLCEEDIDGGKAVLAPNNHTYCRGCVPAEFRDTLIAPNSASARDKDSSAANPRKTPARAPNISTSSGKSGSRIPAMTELRSPSAKHSAPMSSSSIPKKASFPMKWAVLGGAVPLLAMGAALYALGVFGDGSKVAPKETMAVAPQQNPTAIPAVTSEEIKPTAPATLQPPEVAQPAPRNMFEEMAREHKREFDPEQRKAHAARKLKEAVDFNAQNPQDPWAFAEMLERIPKNTPSGEEAARLKSVIKFPDDKMLSAGWYRDWNFVTAGERKTMLYDFAGRKNVLQTLPPSIHSESLFSRSIAIPAEKPFLSFAARCDDNGACLFAVEVDGKQQIMETLKGYAWRTYDLDLSALKGKEALIQMRQVSTSTNPNMYWTQPTFRETPDEGVKPIAFNAVAPAFVRPKAPAPTPKRMFVANAAWKDSPEWKQPVDLLALFDPKADSVSGAWTRTPKGDLQSDSAKAARVAIAYKIPEQYDVRATFERKSGNGDAALILARAGKNFIWTIGAVSNKTMAIAQVAGKNFDGNPAASTCSACLKNGEKHTTVVQVRKDRISAYLDGKLVQEWVPSMGELGLEPTWKIPDGKTLGLASWQSEVIFHSFQLIEVK